MTLEEKKADLIASITKQLQESGISQVWALTCETGARYGWDVLAHHALRAIQRNPPPGWHVHSITKFDCTDWTITWDGPVPENNDAMIKELRGRMLKILNEMCELDAHAVEMLTEHRVACSSRMLRHPSIVVAEPPEPGMAHTVGLLGILNGILNVPVEHRIKAVWVTPEGGVPHLTGFTCEN